MRDQIIGRVKALMHTGDRSDLSPADEALWGDIATAIVDRLGPWELEWIEVAPDAWGDTSDHYLICRNDLHLTEGFSLYMFGVWKDFDTIEAAKAAAQAHHEAEHWKRTRIWE